MSLFCCEIDGFQGNSLPMLSDHFFLIKVKFVIYIVSGCYDEMSP